MRVLKTLDIKHASSVIIGQMFDDQNPQDKDGAADSPAPSPIVPLDVQDAKLGSTGDNSIYQRIRLLNEKQRKVVELILAGTSPAQACRDAGYESSGPLKTIAARMPDIMNRAGLTDQFLVENHLKPLLSAEEVRFFKSTHGMVIMPDGESREADELIETPPRPALNIRLQALDMSFKLRGSYAVGNEERVAGDITVQIVNVGT